MDRLFRLCGLLLTLLLAGPALALDAPASRSLAPELHYLRDASHQLRIDTVLALPAAAWQRNRANTFNQGYDDASWWLRVDLGNARPGLSLLDIGYPVLDEVEVWVLAGDRPVAHYLMGDRHAFDARPIRHRNFLVPLPPGDNHSLLLRVRSSSAIQVPLTLWAPQAFLEREQGHLLAHGLYFGTVGVMVIYNLFVFVVLRERSTLHYIGYALCMATFIGALNGLTFQYLWPHSPTWANQALVVALTGSVAFATRFTQRLLPLREQLPLLWRLIVGLTLLAGLVILLTLLLPQVSFVRATIVVAVASCLSCLLAGSLLWRRGDSSARLYTIAWGALLFGGILLALNKFNVLPQNLFTENAVQVGSALEVILLSFALADRINVERRLRSAAQQEALAAQRRANETLELRVAERTQELEAANRKLAELSTTDQLTGLKNRRHLDQVLRDEVARCQRHRHALAVLLMDIDHFKRFNDSYGHQVGDDCLRAVAAVLQASLRSPSDCVARYGGEEFCMVLPETALEGAYTVAERVRSEVEAMRFEVDGRAVPVTVSIGIATLPPQLAAGVPQLLQQADAALYRSKADGRNRVTVADAPQPAASGPV
jgi:diguanylate cyclase